MLLVEDFSIVRFSVPLEDDWVVDDTACQSCSMAYIWSTLNSHFNPLLCRAAKGSLFLIVLGIGLGHHP